MLHILCLLVFSTVLAFAEPLQQPAKSISADSTRLNEEQIHWIDITLIQPQPYKNWALLVINQSYDATKQKYVELPFEFDATHRAQAVLLHFNKEENKPGNSHCLIIYTIEMLNVESVKLLPEHFQHLPKNYNFKSDMIAHKREAN